MDSIICKNCHSFTVNLGKIVYCYKCKTDVATLKDDDDITIAVNFNNDPDIMSTIDRSSATQKLAQRLAKDKTCMLVDNKICPDCKSKCRFTRASVPVYVCSNCRKIVE